MDTQAIHALCDLNNRFYRDNHESFSDTRRAAWAGWSRLLPLIGSMGPSVRVLDMACGNLRFERFLEERLPHIGFSFTCVDSCPSLARDAGRCRFVESDVIRLLAAGGSLPGEVRGPFDMAASFGFMHHVPTFDLRVQLTRALVGRVQPGGVAVLSFWQFLNDASLARKAREATAAGVEQLGVTLEPDDYLLGWQGAPGVFRYCHHFTDGEVDSLVSAVAGSAVLEDRFRADGRSGDLNCYVVLRRALTAT